MAKTFAVTIQTKPYLKKYLESLYGSPLVFTTKNHFGMIVASSLEKPIEFHHKKEVLKRRTDKYDATLQIHCPKTFFKKRRFGLDTSEKQTITINKLVETQFEEELWKTALYMQAMAGSEIKEALEYFCRNHNIIIDEDITYEALKQKEFRFRKKKEKSAPQLSREKMTII